MANAQQNFFVDTLSSFEVQEKTTALYLMGDVGDTEADYHANFGVRVVKTELQVDGGTQVPVPTWYGTASWNGVNANNVAFTNKRSYTDVLPSFNFTLNATDNQKVRVGAARVVAPQNLMQLGVGQSYNFTRGADDPVTGAARFRFATGSSGNPDLDPFRATQYFLSWEDYVGENGLFARGHVLQAGGQLRHDREHSDARGRRLRRHGGHRFDAGQRRQGQDLRRRARRAVRLGHGLWRGGELHVFGIAVRPGHGVRHGSADPGRVAELRATSRCISRSWGSTHVRPIRGAARR